ncbi:MAG: phospholipase A [Pseudomonadota bacterium]
MRTGLLLIACLIGTSTFAASSEDTSPTPISKMSAQEAIDACRRVADPERRLACYDAIQGIRVTEPNDQQGQAVAEPSSTPDTATAGLVATEADTDLPIDRSSMMLKYELDDATHGGLLRVRRHYSVYALPARYSSDPNTTPSSPAPGRTVTEPLNLDDIEAKFQVSLKTKLLDNLIGDNGDVWFGYTQQSSWQAYNSIESSPFRETNYQPEIFTSWRTGLDVLGWRWQMVNVGFMHQSNGRALPLSRSWNRIYAEFGFERGNFDLFIRPWTAFDTEDQPDIQDFYGRGDVRLEWTRSRHNFALTGRLAVDESRGALQFDWHYPLFGDLKAYLQLFHGYGESLIDYNHKQTTIGLGISLVQ